MRENTPCLPVHRVYSRPEPHILLFRRPVGTDGVTGAVDPAAAARARAAFDQEYANTATVGATAVAYK